MNEQAQEWAGEFGNAYTARNRVDWRKRIPFWKDILERTGARSVLEIGCNAGWNLSAIKRAAPDVRALGIDVNSQAVRQAEAAGLEAWQDQNICTSLTEGLYELTFTAGVLIHIPPADIAQVMQDIALASNRWVLAVEYHADEYQEIPYRGRPGMLWKRPFGQMYEQLGLRPAGPHYVLGPDQGFDNCTVYLMEKP